MFNKLLSNKVFLHAFTKGWPHSFARRCVCRKVRNMHCHSRYVRATTPLDGFTNRGGRSPATYKTLTDTQHLRSVNSVRSWETRANRVYNNLIITEDNLSGAQSSRRVTIVCVTWELQNSSERTDSTGDILVNCSCRLSNLRDLGYIALNPIKIKVRMGHYGFLWRCYRRECRVL